VFVVMLVWALRLDRRELALYAALPLDDDASAPEARGTALRGAQL
jgi:cbb3-type cytochrome oxidase subunit 3